MEILITSMYENKVEMQYETIFGKNWYVIAQ